MTEAGGKIKVCNAVHGDELKALGESWYDTQTYVNDGKTLRVGFFSDMLLIKIGLTAVMKYSCRVSLRYKHRRR